MSSTPTKVIKKPWSTVEIYGRTRVVKTYTKDYWDQGYSSQYDKEIAHYTLLGDCSWKPKLIAFDRDRHMLVMQFVGNRICFHSLPKDWRKQVDQICLDLNAVGLKPSRLIRSNMMVLGEKLYLVDLAALNQGHCDPACFYKLLEPVERGQTWPGGVLTPELYKHITRDWSQDSYQTWGAQLTATTQHVNVLRGLDVVDIGSNSGIVTWVLGQFANSVCGVERNPHYHENAVKTGESISVPHLFVNGPLADFLNHPPFEYNAAYASHVLYLLDATTVEAIRTKMLPRCSTILFVSREDKAKVKSASGIRNPLYKYTAVEAFLRDAGMTTELRDVGTNWVSVIGRRTT